jgi:hypothetical protein
VASTGVAGLLLPGGQTAHSFLGIPIKLDEVSQCGIKGGFAKARLLCRVKLIIWDEVPMQHWHIVETEVRCLRDVTKKNSIFGGIPALFGSNWAQILPFVRDGT